MNELDKARKEFPQSRGRQDGVLVALIREMEPQMNLWRRGATGLPPSYIQIHADYARADLKRVQGLGWTVWGERLETDGWADGMRFVHAAVQSPGGHMMLVKWSDSGLWYVQSPAGGWILCGQPSAKEKPLFKTEPVTAQRRAPVAKPAPVAEPELMDPAREAESMDIPAFMDRR